MIIHGITRKYVQIVKLKITLLFQTTVGGAGFGQPGTMTSFSGLNDYDYQNLSSLSMGMKQLNQLVTTNKIPIPAEIMDHFKRMRNEGIPLLPVQVTHHSLTVTYRHEMQLHDGPLSGDWTCVVDH